MGKKKEPAVSAEELVGQALLRLATADGPHRLSGKGDHPPLFASAAGANKAAIDALQDAARPLVTTAGKGKDITVRLTAAGFQEVLPRLPVEKVGGLVKSLIGDVPDAERVAFLSDIVRRTPEAAAELLAELETATFAEKLEAEERLVAAMKRREAEEATRKAMEQWLALTATLREDRIAALRRELEAEGATPPAMPPARPASAPPPAADGELPVPASRDDIGFRREVAGRLVSAWLESYRLNKPEGRLFLETAMGNVGRFRQIGEEGQRVLFDGKYHDADTGVPPNTPVRVVRPGWVLEEEDGEYRVVPAKVSP